MCSSDLGQECLTIEHEKYHLNQGDFVLIPPGFRHTAQAIDQLTYFCFHFDLNEPNFIVQLIQNSPVFFPKMDPINREIRPILGAMVELVSPTTPRPILSRIKCKFKFTCHKSLWPSIA